MKVFTKVPIASTCQVRRIRNEKSHTRTSPVCWEVTYQSNTGYIHVQKWALAHRHSSMYQWMEPSIGSWHGWTPTQTMLGSTLVQVKGNPISRRKSTENDSCLHFLFWIQSPQNLGCKNPAKPKKISSFPFSTLA